MKNDTDIRKEAYWRIIKWELCWWLVAIAGGLLIAGAFSGSEIVNLFQHGFQGIRDCWVGIMCLLVAGYIVYSLLGILREKRKLIGHGIQAEAVVTAIQKETDAEKGKETLVAVYEFTLPGGKKRQIKEPIENSRAGHLGLIEVGSRVPIFVDRNNPDTFYLYIYSLIRQFYREDKEFIGHIKKLKRQGTDAKTIGQAMLKHQDKRQRVLRNRREWRLGLLVLFAIVTAVGGLLGCVAYWQIETYTLISDLDFPPDQDTTASTPRSCTNINPEPTYGTIPAKTATEPGRASGASPTNAGVPCSWNGVRRD